MKLLPSLLVLAIVGGVAPLAAAELQVLKMEKGQKEKLAPATPPIAVADENDMFYKAEHGDMWAARSLCFFPVKNQINFCRMAAEAGDEQATFAIWRNYEFGYHVAKDREQALHWSRPELPMGMEGARKTLLVRTQFATERC